MKITKRFRVILIELIFGICLCATFPITSYSNDSWIDSGKRHFNAKAGYYKTEQLSGDDDISEIKLDIEVTEAHLHDKWGSTVTIALKDRNDQARIRFWIVYSVKKVGKTAVRVYRDDESEKAHYLESQGFRNYIGQHQLKLQIKENGELLFIVNDQLIETHQKHFRIDGIELIAVGTTADVSWSVK